MFKLVCMSNKAVLLIGSNRTWFIGGRDEDGVWMSSRFENWPSSGETHPSIFIFGDET